MSEIENDVTTESTDQELDLDIGEYEVVEDDERTEEEIDLEMGVTSDQETNDIPTSEEDAPDEEETKSKKKPRPRKKVVSGYRDDTRRQIEEQQRIEREQEIIRRQAEAEQIRQEQAVPPVNNVPVPETAYDEAVKNSFVHTSEPSPIQQSADQIPAVGPVTEAEPGAVQSVPILGQEGSGRQGIPGQEALLEGQDLVKTEEPRVPHALQGASEQEQTVTTAYDSSPEAKTTVYDNALGNSFVHTADHPGVFGGSDRGESYSDPVQAPVKPGQVVDNSMIRSDIKGAELLGNPYNGDRLSTLTGSPAVNDLRMAGGGTVMPEGRYEGVKILPTPPDSLINTYKEVAQHKGAYSSSPETKDTAYDAVVASNRIKTADINTPGYERVISSRDGITQGATDASIDTKAVNPMENPKSNVYFGISRMDMLSPMQEGTGKISYNSGKIEEVRSREDALKAVNKSSVKDYSMAADGATRITRADRDGKNETHSDTSESSDRHKESFEEKEAGRRLEEGAARSFKTSNDRLASFSGVGKSAINSLKTAVTSGTEDNADTRQTKRSLSNMAETAKDIKDALDATGAMGFASVSDMVKEQSDLVEFATEGFQKSGLDRGLLNDEAWALKKGASLNAAKESMINEGRLSAKEIDKSIKKMGRDMDANRYAELREKMEEAGMDKRDINTIMSSSKNREAVRDNLNVQNELKKSMAEREAKGFKDASEKAKFDASKRHVDSTDFYNSRFARENIGEIKTYFANCDDPMLRKINPAGMNIKDLEKLNKDVTSGKIKVSAKHKAMIRKTLRDKKASLKLPKRGKGILGGLKDGLKTLLKPTALLRYVSRMGEDAAAVGAGKILTAYRFAGVGIKVIVFARVAHVKVLDKVTGGRYSDAKRKLIGKVSSSIREAGTVTKTKIKDTAKKGAEKASNTKAGKTIGRTKKKTIGSIRSSRIAEKTREGVNAVQGGLKTASNGIKTAEIAVSNTKRAISARLRKIWMSKAMAPVRGAAKVVSAPFKAISSASKALSKALAAVAKWLGVAIGILILAFLIVTLGLSILISVMNVVSKATEGAADTVMIDEKVMKDWIKRYNDKDKEKYKEALDIAKGAPKRPDALYGQKLYHYGSPQGNTYDDYLKARKYHNNIPLSETDNGYHIYYVDAQGNTLGQDTTNTKDIICLTTVMFQNDFCKDSFVLNLLRKINVNPDGYTFSQAQALMDKWFDILNPDITWVESDLYHTENSTDRFIPKSKTYTGGIYYCNDENFYNEYNYAKKPVEEGGAGVIFYEEPAEDHSHDTHHHGCEFDQDGYDSDMDNWRDREPQSPDWDDFYPYDDPDFDDYDDIDSYNEAIDDYNEAVGEYNDALADYERNYNDWMEDEPNQDDYWYCPGHFSTIDAPGNIYPAGKTPGLKCSYGYRDINLYVTILTKDDVYHAAETDNKIHYRVPKNYECTEWEEKTVSIEIPAGLYSTFTKKFYESGGWNYKPDEGEAKDTWINREWCDKLFDQSWYDTYGVDVYEDGVSLSVGGGLSEAEIAELIEGWDDSVSEGRAAFVQFALNQVGKIPYYFGGHARVQGYDGNDFGKTITPDEYNAKKGRNKKGLDCSGFVSWVYWTVFGVKPGQTTASFTNSLGLQKISFDQLKPGDIGLEAMPGSKNNHIGIFVKFDEKTGRAVWVHENSSNVNVGVNQTNVFRLYYRLNR